MLIPDGYIRLDEAYRDLVALMNVSDRCDPITGSPRNWSWQQATDSDRRQEWAVRIRRANRAELLLWDSIGGTGGSAIVKLWTFPSSGTDPHRVHSSALAASTTDRSSTMKSGYLIRFVDPHEAATPLFLRQDEWDRQKESWSRQLRPLSKRAQEFNCERWLSDQIAKDSGSRTKNDFRSEAMNLFPKLGNRAFDRAWGRSAPDELKRPGRRRTTQNQGT